MGKIPRSRERLSKETRAKQIREEIEKGRRTSEKRKRDIEKIRTGAMREISLLEKKVESLSKERNGLLKEKMRLEEDLLNARKLEEKVGTDRDALVGIGDEKLAPIKERIKRLDDLVKDVDERLNFRIPEQKRIINEKIEGKRTRLAKLDNLYYR
jgi:chromosome segregation ATPase